MLLKGLLGHEWDEDIDNGHRPEGLMRLSATTVHNVQIIVNHGSVFDTGTCTHHLVLYHHYASSKAGTSPATNATEDHAPIVFGAGTVQWTWGWAPLSLPFERCPPQISGNTNLIDMRLLWSCWVSRLDPHHDTPTGLPNMVENAYDTRVNYDINGAPDTNVMQARVHLCVACPLPWGSNMQKPLRRFLTIGCTV